jgi:hypothetical protein
MNNATLTGFRMLAEAMVAKNNYAVQIKVGGRWQLVIDRLTKAEADKLAARWDRSRVVQTF